jgi:light-regulated signal transduction histidine kinase (bacteriophytochrome)
LRAPARHVLGFAELLNKQLAGWSDPAAQRLIRVITDSARRMAQLIDDLLTFSRTSRQELHRGKVNMDQRVEEALRLLAPELAGRRIEWQIAPLPVVEGDASLLTQVWVNLLSNAIKYTRRREVASILIEGHKEEHQSVFSIGDNGTGFDLQYSQKLFGVFQRLHREEEYEGTGIGLANVARIIQRHGGRVWADAALDRGATFYFTIPHAQSAVIGPRRPGDGGVRGNGHSRPPTG